MWRVDRDVTLIESGRADLPGSNGRREDEPCRTRADRALRLDDGGYRCPKLSGSKNDLLQSIVVGKDQLQVIIERPNFESLVVYGHAHSGALEIGTKAGCALSRAPGQDFFGYEKFLFNCREKVPSVTPDEGGNVKRLVTAILGAALTAGFAGAADESPIAGSWLGKTGDVPVVTLTIRDDDGKLSGTAVFYKIVDDGGGPQVEGKSTVEMIGPKLEGKTFSFQTKNSHGELLSYQMELTAKNEGKFKGAGTVAGGGEAPEIPMIRE